MIGITKCPVRDHGRILVATDGSDFSRAAICEAIDLARACSSKIYVLSVIEVNPEFEALAPELIEKAEEQTRKYLGELKTRINQEGLDCETIVHQGEEPYKFIIDEARQREADIIVMGSHGRTGLKRLLMGSVTSRVIGHADCPVLVVKAQG